MFTINLTRNKFTKTETRGTLTDNSGALIGYTIEPASVEKVQMGNVCSLPEGKYVIELRNNPTAGTPTIKLIGKNASLNSSIRCCRPIGKNNPSITLLSQPDGSGDPGDIDFEAWQRLLLLLTNNSYQLIISSPKGGGQEGL